MNRKFFRQKPRALALITAMILLVSGISFASAREESHGLTGVRLLDSGGEDLAGRRVEADAPIILEYTYGNTLDSNHDSDPPSSSYDEEIPVEVPPEIDLTAAEFKGAVGTVTGPHRASVKLPAEGAAFQVRAFLDREEAAKGGRRALVFPLADRDETILIEIVPAVALFDSAAISRFDELVTGIEIYDGDPTAGGKLMSGGSTPPTVSKDKTLYIKYQFNVSPGQVGAGAEYEVSSPEGLLWNGPKSEKSLMGGIKKADGTIIDHEYGTLHINTEASPKNVSVSFASDFNETDDEKFGGTLNDGNIYVYSGPDPDKADENGKLDIKWNNRTVLTVYVEEKVPKQAKLEKKGELSDGNFLWTITYTPGKKEPVPDSIVDRFDPTYQSYVPGSFTVNGTAKPDPAWAADGGNQKMSYPLTNPDTDTVTLTYKTTPTDNAFKTEGDVTVSNEAWLAKGGVKQEGTDDSGTATLGNDKKAWVKKSGEYDAANRCLHWTVTIHTFGRNIADLKMTDELPEGVSLPAQVEVVGYTPITPVTSGGTGKNGGPKFEVTIPKNTSGGYDDVYTVRYDTKIDDSYYDGSKPDKAFPNDVTLSFTWYPLGGGPAFDAITPGDGDSPKVTTNMIQKSGEYDRSQHQITWKIVVNPYGVDLTGYTITVDDPLTDQEYIGPKDGSFPSGVVCNLADSAHPVFTITGVTTNKLEFSFITELTNSKDYAGNNPGNKFEKQYRNTAHMEAVGASGTIKSDAVGNVDVVSQVVSKAGTDFDYTKNEITWQVVVNQNKMPMKAVSLRDLLPEGLSYVADSLEINGSKAGPANTSPLEISLGDLNNEATVKFRTKVDTDKYPDFKNSSQVVIPNEIVLHRDTYDDVRTSGAQSIANKALDKKGAVKNNGASIEYTVKLNPLGLSFRGGEVLTDDLPLGLELDVQTVKLYKASVDSTGKVFTPGDPVKLVKGSNFSYEDDGSGFSIVMPAGKSPYLLTYTADLNGKAVGPFTNEIKFEGFQGDIGSSSAAGIGGGGGGGGISYRQKGTIRIIKKDQNGNPVPGALFTLGQDTQKTGNDGIATFFRVPVGKHTLEETPPTGYVLEQDQADKLKDVEVKKDEDAEVIVINRKLPSAPSGSGGGGGGSGGGASSSGGTGSSGSGGGMLTPPSIPSVSVGREPPAEETVEETTPRDTPKDGVIEAPADSHFVLTTAPESGTVVVNGDGSWNYTPAPGFYGTDRFVVEVREPGGKKRPVNVLVTIEDPPVPKGPANTGGGLTA